MRIYLLELCFLLVLVLLSLLGLSLKGLGGELEREWKEERDVNCPSISSGGAKRERERPTLSWKRDSSEFKPKIRSALYQVSFAVCYTRFLKRSF